MRTYEAANDMRWEAAVRGRLEARLPLRTAPAYINKSEYAVHPKTVELSLRTNNGRKALQRDPKKKSVCILCVFEWLWWAKIMYSSSTSKRFWYFLFCWRDRKRYPKPINWIFTYNLNKHITHGYDEQWMKVKPVNDRADFCSVWNKNESEWFCGRFFYMFK